MREEKAITRKSGGPFSRVNWDSPASVSDMTGHGPAVRADEGWVVTFACGCASWVGFPDEASATIPEGWVGARLVPYRRVNGRKVDSEGRWLRSYMNCTHGNDDGWQT